MEYKNKTANGAAMYVGETTIVPQHAILLAQQRSILGDQLCYASYLDTPTLTIYGVSCQRGKTFAWVYPDYETYRRDVDAIIAHYRKVLL